MLRSSARKEPKSTLPNKLDQLKSKVRDFTERRLFPRLEAACEVRVPVGVSVPNENLNPEAEHYPEPIMGHTRNLSRSGMSIILPSVQLGDDRVDEKDYPLRLVVSLPQGIIIVHARTVRSELSDQPSGERKFLLGVAITKMSDRDRTNYDAFLHSLS